MQPLGLWGVCVRVGKEKSRSTAEVRAGARAEFEGSQERLVELRTRTMEQADRWAASLIDPHQTEAYRSLRDVAASEAFSNAIALLDDGEMLRDFESWHDPAWKRWSQDELGMAVEDFLTMRGAEMLLCARDGVAEALEASRAFRRDIDRKGTRALHNVAEKHNWDCGHAELFAIVNHPKCSIATAALIYWRSSPAWPDEGGWAEERATLAKTVEGRVRRGKLVATSNYCPKSDRGWSRPDLEAVLHATPTSMHFDVRAGKRIPWS